MILVYGLMLLILLVGIWHAAYPESVFRWKKACKEIEGIVMVESPAPETVRYFRLWGVGMIIFAVVGAVLFAITR